jgi:hypothetical protein
MTARAWGLAVLLTVVFGLNLRAIGSRDTHVTEFVALSLAAEGNANLDEYPALVETGLARGYLTRTTGGHVLSNYPIVPALVAAPAYWIAVRSGWLDPANPMPARVEAIGKLVASGLTALACAVLFVIVERRVGRPALAATLVTALGTPLWSSASQALWSHGPAALALAVGFLLTEDSGRDRPSDRGPGVSFAAGLGFGLAAACRPLLIFFLLGAVVDAIRRKDRRVVWLAAGAVLTLGAVAAYHALSFGTLLGGQSALESAVVHQQTHLVDGTFTAVPLAGLAGILISPSRGVLIFCPIVIWAAVGAWRARHDARALVRLTLPIAAFILAWSQYAVWWGGHSYGPRYLSDIAIPLGVLLGHGLLPLQRGWGGLRSALAGWSIAVQLAGAVGYPGGAWNSVPADVDRAHERLWDWRDSQIVRTVRAGPYRRAGAVSDEAARKTTTDR